MADRFFVELSDELKSNIVIKDLEEQIEYFHNEIQQMNLTKMGSGYMSWDYEEDLKATQETIEHFEFVLQYYKG